MSVFSSLGMVEERTNWRKGSSPTENCAGPVKGDVPTPEVDANINRATLDQLTKYSRVLLLQGPNGPYFSRLRTKLERAGVEVWKVNFNSGDDLFYRGERVIRFCDSMSKLPEFLERIVSSKDIQAIVVFGNGRRPHRIAARVAQKLQREFWVFEEGYIRPDYITLERGGVNASSPLAKLQMEDVAAIPEVEKESMFPNPFAWMAWYSFLYFAAALIFGRRYPNYSHHKRLSWTEAIYWGRSIARKYWFAFKERRIRRKLLSVDHPRFFIAVLQVYNDNQIRAYSPWKRMEDFLEWTISSFSNTASADTILVVKHHPMDRGHKDYGGVIRRLANRFRVSDRLLYIHDIHLPSVLKNCAGVVTINSTTGLQALHHGVPVKLLGRCFYDKEGLTYQGSLDAFWASEDKVDLGLYKRFRSYLIFCSQINSSFYADHNFVSTNPQKKFEVGLRYRLLFPFLLVLTSETICGIVDVGSMLTWLC